MENVPIIPLLPRLLPLFLLLVAVRTERCSVTICRCRRRLALSNTFTNSERVGNRWLCIKCKDIVASTSLESAWARPCLYLLAGLTGFLTVAGVTVREFSSLVLIVSSFSIPANGSRPGTSTQSSSLQIV